MSSRRSRSGGRQNVIAQHVGQFRRRPLIEQFDPVHEKVFMLAKGHRRPPLLPPCGAMPRIEDSSHQANDDASLCCHIQVSTLLSDELQVSSNMQ